MFAPTAYLHPREEILQAMERIYRYRMTTTSGGNLSIQAPNGNVWITPASIDKGSLRRDDIVCVHPDGTMDGIRKPSSELPIHQMIRVKRPELGGIVHAHPTALVAYSLVHKVPNTRLFHQSHRYCGEPGFIPYEIPGSLDLGAAVAEGFAKGYNAVILENHGAVTAGKTFQEAFRRFETLEFTGKILIKASLLGGKVNFLTDEQLALEEKREFISESFEPDYPSSDENEVRRKVAEFVRRAYRQRLFISTQGSFSARVGKDSFVITPRGVDRGSMEPHNLVLVKDGRHEAGKTPSRAALAHQEIYRKHPEVGAIVNAYPVNATAFSVSGMTLDSRTIPESYVVIRNVGSVKYGAQFDNGSELAAKLSETQPAIVVENDGVLVTCADITKAFDRLEVLEATAEAIINSRAIGSLQPLSDQVTKDLDRVFFGV